MLIRTYDLKSLFFFVVVVVVVVVAVVIVLLLSVSLLLVRSDRHLPSPATYARMSFLSLLLFHIFFFSK